MSTESTIKDSIESAADTVGSVWPLHSFVTSNPLSGFEDQPFHEAVEEAEDLIGGDGYPSHDVFRRAWESGQIDTEVLERRLRQNGYGLSPEESLDRMAEKRAETDDDPRKTAEMEKVDAVLTKWLAAFLDQGHADWSMPNREEGFYEAFRTVARHDTDIPDRDFIADLPDDPIEAVKDCLADYQVGDWHSIFDFQMAELPGWTGYLKQRADDDGAWQSKYPITLSGYLAVRLTLVDLFDAPLAPSEEYSGDTDRRDSTGEDREGLPLPEVWLAAWEETYKTELVESIQETGDSASDTYREGRPDAQLVFCIDTRSEIIRRHIEEAGKYETHGYAGFFGVPMRYSEYDGDVDVDACPPILDPQHRITDRPAEDCDSKSKDEYENWQKTLTAGKKALKSIKSNAATAFSFVESTGVGYGAALATRTILPARVYDLFDTVDEHVPDDHEFCEPSLDFDCDAPTHDSDHGLREGLTLDEKVEYAQTAFELMGWEEFARLVVFTGHASQTTNNPFDSSLDCGACAGNPGGPNARVLAAICNDGEVKRELRDRGIAVPDDTVFVAAEHNTTTDGIEIYDSRVPESHEEDLEQLRDDLETAREAAAEERSCSMGVDGDAESRVRDTERRAADWAETRPEWGLAGNAGFVVGPRTLTQDCDLDGRSFLHSYDWRTDPEGDALEDILTGPMVVTQWINAQYYFGTVDNAVYGSGSKVTHNPIGNIGVYQGNGGDLMTGLPLESLMSADDEPYHQPLRLSTVVHAPVENVTEILSENDEITRLLDNNWLSLTVVDPQRGHRAFEYDGSLSWTPATDETAERERVSITN
ncbi:DUF2309 domain-containing protein [Halorutilales archaeon Cl-col2-1]